MLAGANRKLARGGSYDAVHEIVLTLINDNRGMQNKVNALSEKLEQSRFQIMRLRSNLNKAEEMGARDARPALATAAFSTMRSATRSRAHARKMAVCA